MAAPSRMLLKSTTAALNLFARSKSVLNRLPLRASAGLAIPSTSAKFTDQLAVVIEQQLPVGIRGLGEMLIARGRPPPKVVDSGEDDDDGDEEDEDELEDFDDEEFEDAVDEDEDDDVATWKKVRTRSDRDGW
uniref:Uncharacterized protein n=1 Tax=Kalanchoe fedtschenkoi TaxID=63787 RepID=A0A7N0VKM4_KALFE